MNRQITPYEFMISEVHPEYIFNEKDIYLELVESMTDNCNPIHVEYVVFTQLEEKQI